jgi:hypothetical protein
MAALAFVTVHYVLRRAKPSNAGKRAYMLYAAGAWGLYALWEWLVLVRTPEADIRVDLLLIWPCVGLISLWAIIKSSWRRP